MHDGSPERGRGGDREKGRMSLLERITGGIVPLLVTVIGLLGLAWLVIGLLLH